MILLKVTINTKKHCLHNYILLVRWIKNSKKWEWHFSIHIWLVDLSFVNIPSLQMAFGTKFIEDEQLFYEECSKCYGIWIYHLHIISETKEGPVLKSTVLPRSIAKILVCPDFPPLKIPRYTAKLSYRHPPQVFRHKSHETNLNSPISTAHNYLLTAVYWSVIIECQDWSSDTVIDLIVEGRNRWSVVLIRIITCIYFSSDYF